MRGSWLDPWPDFEAIFAEVWRTMRVAYVWPRHITSRWTSSPRGKSLSLPLPRSWLGGRTIDPYHRLTIDLTTD